MLVVSEARRLFATRNEFGCAHAQHGCAHAHTHTRTHAYMHVHARWHCRQPMHLVVAFPRPLLLSLPNGRFGFLFSCVCVCVCVCVCRRTSGSQRPHTSRCRVAESALPGSRRRHPRARGVAAVAPAPVVAAQGPVSSASRMTKLREYYSL